MKILTIGACPLCGMQIWDFKRLPFIQISKACIAFNFRRVPTGMKDNGRHFWILQSNGSRMMVAICKDCFKNLTDEKVREIFANIIYTKLKQTENEGWQVFDTLRVIEVFKWFGSEREVADYLKGYSNEKACSLNESC